MGLNCECGECRVCRQREKRQLMSNRERRETPLGRRMNAKAEEVWARHADPEYYAPASERFRRFELIDRVVRV